MGKDSAEWPAAQPAPASPCGPGAPGEAGERNPQVLAPQAAGYSSSRESGIKLCGAFLEPMADFVNGITPAPERDQAPACSFAAGLLLTYKKTVGH